MKRTRLRTRTPLTAKRNAEGKPRERFEGLRDEAFREWIRGRPCLVASERCFYARHRSEAAHVKSKATGNGDAGQLVPLCTRHHAEQHDYGIRSFEREYDVRLAAAASALWIEYEQSTGKPQL